MATVTRSGVQYKIINARYSSKCVDCNVQVQVGERILWAPGVKGVHHAVCADSVTLAKAKLDKGYAEMAFVTKLYRDKMLDQGFCPECRGAGVVVRNLNFSDTLDYSDFREVYVTCNSVPAHLDTRRSGLTSDRGFAHFQPSDCRGGETPAYILALAVKVKAEFGVAMPRWALPADVVRAPEGVIGTEQYGCVIRARIFNGIEERPGFGFVTEFSDLGCRAGHVPSAIVHAGRVWELESGRWTNEDIKTYRNGGQALYVEND